MNPAVTIRFLDAEDASTYKASRLEALRSEPTAFTSSWETARELADTFFTDRASFQPDNFIVGAFVADALVGTAGGYVQPELKRRHIGHVVGMWVDPDHRRQGIARKLLDAAVVQLRSLPGIVTIQLAVTAGNVAAQTLYESYGFVAWGTQPTALKHGERYYDEVCLSLSV